MAKRFNHATWFKVFVTQEQTITALSDESVGKALKMCLKLVKDGSEPSAEELNDFQTKLAYLNLKVGADESVEEYSKSVENGKRGGRPKKEEVPTSDPESQAETSYLIDDLPF